MSMLQSIIAQKFHRKQCSTHKIALRKADKSTKDVKNSKQCERHERFFHSHNVRLRENKSQIFVYKIPRTS